MGTLNDQDRGDFNINPQSFTWKEGVYKNAFGLQKFVLKQDVSLAFENGKQIIKKYTETFDDIHTFFRGEGKNIKSINLDEKFN